MASADLTTSVYVQRLYGGMATNVEQVNAYISALSEQILATLGRQSILPGPCFEAFDGAGTPAIMLRNWPVQSIQSIVVNNQTVPAAPPNAPNASMAPGWLLEPALTTPPGRPQMLSLRAYRFGRGVSNVTVAYTAGYQVSNEAAVVPAVAPFTLNAKQLLGAWGSDVDVVRASGVPLIAMPLGATLIAGQYSADAGVYAFAAADAGAAVLLSYGFIPQSLARACALWVIEEISYSARPGQKSKSLGGQETAAFDTTAIPVRVAAALQPFKWVF